MHVVHATYTTHAVLMHAGNRKKKDSCGLYEWVSHRYTSYPPYALKKQFTYTIVVCINGCSIVGKIMGFKEDKLARRES